MCKAAICIQLKTSYLFLLMDNVSVYRYLDTVAISFAPLQRLPRSPFSGATFLLASAFLRNPFVLLIAEHANPPHRGPERAAPRRCRRTSDRTFDFCWSPNYLNIEAARVSSEIARKWKLFSFAFGNWKNVHAERSLRRSARCLDSWTALMVAHKGHGESNDLQSPSVRRSSPRTH